MTEYIGYKDPTGDGLCEMGLTDEEVIRCRDCAHIGSTKLATHHCWSEIRWHCYELQRDTTLDGYCAWAVRRP